MFFVMSSFEDIGVFLVECWDFECIYLQGVFEVMVLGGVDLMIVCGEYFVIMGIFGSGKLMLMNIFGCFDWLMNGEYLFIGCYVEGMDDDEFLVLCGCIIGFVF